MKIFITGACGFIGSHLAERLLREHDVTAMAIYSARDTYGWLDGIDVRKVRGDVRDAEFMARAIRGHDLVYHLAAIGGIPFSYDSPRTVWETNATGTLNVLEACRQTDAKIVHTSTSEVFGTALYTPQDEAHPLQPQSPYAASKSAADALVRSYLRSYEMDGVIIRPFNTYGPRQSQRAFISSIIRQLLSRAPYIEVGDLTPTRDMNFVDDTVDAFVLAKDLEGEYNVGSGVQTSMRDIYEKLAALADDYRPLVHVKERERPKTSEVFALEADATRIKERGWRPRFSLDEGLKRTFEWCEKHGYNSVSRTESFR